jgi:nucleotide-binding universal stress UspA family protein
MKRILCPVDFSSHARVAARLAVSVARRSGGVVCLYHAVPHFEQVSIPPRVREEHLRGVSRQVVASLDEWKAALLQELPSGEEVTIETFTDGSEPGRGILRRAVEWGAHLVVAGSLGVSGAGGATFGSVAARVARDASCPVLVVSRGQEDRIPVGRAFQHPLAAIDYSRFSLPAVTAAAALSEPGATIQLVHVLLVAPELHGDELAAALGEARALELDRLREFARRVDEVPVAVKLRADGEHVADQILAYVASSATDLVVLGAHGRDERIAILGTVADRILRASAAPVLVIPDAALEPA